MKKSVYLAWGETPVEATHEWRWARRIGMKDTPWCIASIKRDPDGKILNADILITGSYGMDTTSMQT